MGKRSSPELTLTLLLMASVYSEAFRITKWVYYSPHALTWTEARLYCQKKHTDMATWGAVDAVWMTDWLNTLGAKNVWIGLARDPENHSAWKWINLKTGEGLSGGDVSQSTNWASGKESQLCAAVSDEYQKWYAAQCLDEHGFHCSVDDKIRHHKDTLDWFNASQYCQAESGQLATVTQINTGKFAKSGWIGLYQGADETWQWIGDSQSDYRNWEEGEPLNRDCAYLNVVDQKWYSTGCSKKHEVVCYDDKLLVVKENKTWEEALMHCQNIDTKCSDSSGPCIIKYNLLSLERLSDYDYVRDRIYTATTDEVWMGLRFLGNEWFWVDGQKLKDQGKLQDCPSQWKHCGTLSKHDTNNWIIRDCSERRNFICYRVKEMVAT